MSLMSHYGKNRFVTTKHYAGKMKSGKSTASTASRALKIATNLASLINVEKKNIQYISSNTSTSSPIIGLFQDLTYIAQGNDINERTGNSVKAMDVSWRLRFDGNPSAFQPVQMIRFMIFKWNDDTAPTASVILDNYQNGAVNSCYNPLNVNAIGRFTVLHDEWIAVAAQKANGAPAYSKVISGYKKLGFHTKFFNNRCLLWRCWEEYMQCF